VHHRKDINPAKLSSQFIVVLFIGAATAAQLPSAYVPPSAKSAGGNSQFLQTPNNQYIPPSSSQGYPAARTTKSADADAQTLRFDNSPNTGDGSYSYSFETSNGIKQEEQGYNTQQGENSEQIVMGSYSYMGDDGQMYTVTYKADANGFQPQGDHLPTPPPIPEAIQK
jgi:Insect cuticle protein